MSDMTPVIVPKSDQWNSDDFVAGGPRTFTIKDVQIRPGTEQPVSIALEGSNKVYRPCKTMSRCLVSAWGPDAKKYVGRSMTLYCDPTVKWAGIEIGGIRISHLSHIDGPKRVVLTATKGSRKPHTIQPLTDAPQSQVSEGPNARQIEVVLEDLKALARPGNIVALQSKWQEIGAPARKALGGYLEGLKAACVPQQQQPPADDDDDVAFDSAPQTQGGYDGV